MPRHQIAALAALLTLLLAGPAAAQPGKAPKGDKDRDGLADRVERALGTDPARADSDGDGTKDGREGAGKVVARKGDRLVVRLFGGGTVRARLTAATEVGCPEPEEAEDAPDAEDEVPLEAEDAPDEEAPEELPVDLPAELEAFPGDGTEEEDDEAEEDEPACSADDLRPGALLSETDVAGKGKRRRWTRVVLAGY
jgi:hypothetical protein